MAKLINKLVVLLCCLSVFVIFTDTDYMVAPVIVVVIISALCSFFDRREFKLAGLIAFSCLGLFYPNFLFFAPLILYDLFAEPYALSGFIVLVPAAVSFSLIPWKAHIIVLLLVSMSYIIKHYSNRLEGLKTGYHRLRDETKEIAFSLERNNKELLEKQDYEINLATLNERNRIAREIHDSVGHIMSSSILQVGALIATVKDEVLEESLNDLKTTLAEGMDSIRSSVHNLHEDSIDLDAQLYALTRDFAFCSLSYEYSVEVSPDLKTKYSLIAIVKEGLSNIIKHSDATAASLTLREFPGFYQMIISDNGTPKEHSSETGMGIRSISSRVESLNGHFNIDKTRGYRLFISIPKDVNS